MCVYMCVCKSLQIIALAIKKVCIGGLLSKDNLVSCYFTLFYFMLFSFMHAKENLGDWRSDVQGQNGLEEHFKH